MSTTTRLFCARKDGTHERWCGARADHTDTHGHALHAGDPGTCAGCHAEYFGAPDATQALDGDVWVDTENDGDFCCEQQRWATGHDLYQHSATCPRERRGVLA